MNPTASPCTGVCQMDAASGWCRGCARRLDEITGWGEAPEPRRRDILCQLPARRAELLRRGLWLPAPASLPSPP